MHWSSCLICIQCQSHILGPHLTQEAGEEMLGPYLVIRGWFQPRGLSRQKLQVSLSNDIFVSCDTSCTLQAAEQMSSFKSVMVYKVNKQIITIQKYWMEDEVQCLTVYRTKLPCSPMVQQRIQLYLSDRTGCCWGVFSILLALHSHHPALVWLMLSSIQVGANLYFCPGIPTLKGQCVL